MLDTHFDPHRLQQQSSLQIIDLPIEGYIDLYRSISDQEAALLIDPVKQIGLADGLHEEDFTRSIKSYIALRMLAEKHHLSALAVRCWPELKEQNIVAPCLALSLLTNQGIPAACEGDACGAISMLIAQLLTGRPAFFGDLVALDDSTNEVLMFHCGAGAPGLSEKQENVILMTHSRPVMWTPGITVEFPVGPGPATYLRFGELGQGFRLLLADGDTVRHSPHCRGTTLHFKPRGGGRAMLSGLMAAGAEHHQIIALGDISQEAAALCEMWGIPSQRVADA